MGTVKPDTWAAVDGLGRTVSSYAKVGPKRNKKTVGCFYWIWFEYWKGYQARNATSVVRAHPEAWNDFQHPAWEDASVYWWDEPLLGYYQNLDTFVLRKHAELLADAGVDVIIFDCSNNDYTFPDSYEVLFKVFEQAKSEGVQVPQIAFLLNFWHSPDSIVQMKDLYEHIYSKGRYQDLWFYWDGKPLLMAHSNHLNLSNPIEKEIKEFFTFRRNEATYFCKDFPYSEEADDINRSWGWCSVYPQTKFGVREDGSVEQMCVSVAQNASNGQLVAMNYYKGGVHGRGYTKGDYAYHYTYRDKTVTVDQNTEDAFIYGLNFQQQWDYALEVDPDFIFITGWNEGIGVRLKDWYGSPNAFSDNFNDEFSRDIEPSKGRVKDYFYYQLVDNIRKFKGVSKPDMAASDAHKTVDIHADGDQWADVSLAFNHYTGSTQDRDIDGFTGTHYVNHTMRNDIVTSKVAYDEDNIYFMVESLADLTPATDPAWMRLLIQTDLTGCTPNWEGFTYIVNRVSPTGSKAVLEKSTGGWHFDRVGTVDFHVSGKRLQIAIPRAMLGLVGTEKLSFNFKWADNTRADGAVEDSGDILDFYQYGDVAPGGRFMFTFRTEG